MSSRLVWPPLRCASEVLFLPLDKDHHWECLGKLGNDPAELAARNMYRSLVLQCLGIGSICQEQVDVVTFKISVATPSAARPTLAGKNSEDDLHAPKMFIFWILLWLAYAGVHILGQHLVHNFKF